MAQWKETLEPYIKVYERVRTATIVPTAGEDLIVGATLISDSGPSTPVLITNQREFLDTFASRDLTKEYIDSLDTLYKGDDKKLASTMWLNAYRLAGSTNLLVVRATKGKDISYVKPLSTGSDLSTYIIRDGQLLKKVPEFKLVIDRVDNSATGTATNRKETGWAISINEIGIFGNLTDENGPVYDYYTRTLKDLVDQLNASSKFFSPDYKFYKNPEATTGSESVLDDGSDAVSVVFNEVYLAKDFLDKGAFGVATTAQNSDNTSGSKGDGLAYLISCEKEGAPSGTVIDLNDTSYSGFTADQYYATNVYNSNSDLEVRIRRFNHDAVVNKEVAPTINDTEDSPYIVLTDVLEVLGEKNKERDFYEVAVLDPSIDKDPLYFNIGNIPGRGDMTVEEVNKSLKMINLVLPDDMSELGLEYHESVGVYEEDLSHSSTISQDTVMVGFVPTKKTKGANEIYVLDSDERTTVYCWINGNNLVSGQESEIPAGYTKITDPTIEQNLPPADDDDEIRSVLTSQEDRDVAVKVSYYTNRDGKWYKWVVTPTNTTIHADLGIDVKESSILNVSPSDLQKSISLITEDEIYTVEGLTDLGNTDLQFQSYLCNMAKNENYFYPISSLQSTNYLAIANYRTKLAQDSYKLYTSAPWDVDTGTSGWKFYASPSVIYWEAVSKNRSMNSEFASVFGFGSTGQVLYTNPITEFTKKQRQLLLSKQINTVMWNTQNQTWNMNDCYTMTSDNNILNEDGNSRLFIRINKAIPTLLRPLVGRKISDVTYSDAETILKFWFNRTILPMKYSVDDYRITIANLEANDDQARRQNKMYVLVECRFARSLKYIIVYSDALDMGMEFTGEI